MCTNRTEFNVENRLTNGNQGPSNYSKVSFLAMFCKNDLLLPKAKIWRIPNEWVRGVLDPKHLAQGAISKV